MQKEVLTVDVNITGATEVKGDNAEVCMISFDGSATGPYFNGKILPGGIDTQKEFKGLGRQLSARYVLEGVDYKGNSCKIFIENNGRFDENGNIITEPLIITDSEELEFLTKKDLKGTVEGKASGGVLIHIYE